MLNLVNYPYPHDSISPSSAPSSSRGNDSGHHHYYYNNNGHGQNNFLQQLQQASKQENTRKRRGIPKGARNSFSRTTSGIDVLLLEGVCSCDQLFACHVFLQSRVGVSESECERRKWERASLVVS